jgi:hypothetical protein
MGSISMVNKEKCTKQEKALKRCGLLWENPYKGKLCVRCVFLTKLKPKPYTEECYVLGIEKHRKV